MKSKVIVLKPNNVCNVFVWSPFYCLLKALEKAKEAGRKERALCRQREQSAHHDQINLDLTYSVSTMHSRILHTIKLPPNKDFVNNYLIWTNSLCLFDNFLMASVYGQSKYKE